MTPIRVKIFADGASLADMRRLSEDPGIQGFTTNPTLMRSAGVRDYAQFAREVVRAIPDRPISFEVLADDFCQMERQAREIASWGDSVFVKIPITNTRGVPAIELIHRLSADGLQINVTAIMTLRQAAAAVDAVAGGARSFLSIFAGRIADTGRDPVPVIRDAVALAAVYPSIRLIWASPREILNVDQADGAGCHVITLTTDLLKKLALRGKDLDLFSRETVQMFYDDSLKAGLTLGGVPTT